MSSPIKQMIPKAVLFDAAGTLFDSSRAVPETYARLAENHGKRVSTASIATNFRRCFATAPPLAFASQDMPRLKELERMWWRELVWRIFDSEGPFPEFDAYFSELFDYFAQPEAWQVYDDTLPTLVTLKERGYILAVVSNFDSRVLSIMEGLGIASLVDSIFISSSTGYAKPAPEIFRQVLKRHDLGPDEAIHVGDSPETDVEGALQAGIAPVLVDRKGKQEHPKAVRLDCLRELLDLLAPHPHGSSEGSSQRD